MRRAPAPAILPIDRLRGNAHSRWLEEAPAGNGLERERVAHVDSQRQQ